MFQLHQEREKGLLGSLVNLILSFFSLLYGAIGGARVFLYQYGFCKSKKLRAKVISVGNVTVGGTGKTPLSIYLAQKLKEGGGSVAILSRGYRRRKKQMVALTHKDWQRTNWEDVGDEPYLMSRRLSDVPVVVGKNKSASGEYAIKKFGTKILILDDGFQHLGLFRDLDIVVIDSTNPFGNKRLLPAGSLREPLNSLKRADMFVLTKTDQVPNINPLIQTLKGYNPRAPAVESIYQIHSIEKLLDGCPIDPKGLEGKKVFAFSGIGNPSSFEDSLKQLKIQLLSHRMFPDHFPYRKRDLLTLQKEAKGKGAHFIITTEKDSVRIPLINQQEIPLLVVKIDLKITRGEKILLSRIGREIDGDKN